MPSQKLGIDSAAEPDQADDVVDRSAAADGREDAGRNADRSAMSMAWSESCERDRQLLDDHLADRQAGADGEAEIALQDGAEPA